MPFRFPFLLVLCNQYSLSHFLTSGSINTGVIHPFLYSNSNYNVGQIVSTCIFSKFFWNLILKRNFIYSAYNSSNPSLIAKNIIIPLIQWVFFSFKLQCANELLIISPWKLNQPICLTFFSLLNILHLFSDV